MPTILLDVLPWLGIRDPISMLSHLLGAALSAVALAALLRRARRRGLPAEAHGTLMLYGVSMVLAFAASALFHTPSEESVLLKKLDHAAIFLVIAGTCTAIYGSVRRRWASRLTAGLWLACGSALVVKMLLWPMPLWLTAAVYLVVALPALAGLPALGRVVGRRRLVSILAGGLLLLVGMVVFATRWPVLWPGVIEGHEVFHLLVLAAVGLHFHFIYAHATDLRAYHFGPSADVPGRVGGPRSEAHAWVAD